jgi:hypothetical protein
MANAESVYVKYIGSVDLKGYNCQDTNSSFVHRVCYSKAQEAVVVLLGANYYKYCGVSDKAINQWLTATSKGKFYNSYIRGNYYC